MRQLAAKIGLLAVSVLAALALGEGILRAAGFAFEIAPEAVEFGWPDPVVLKEHYAGDPDLFWVLKDYDSSTSALRSSGVPTSCSWATRAPSSATIRGFWSNG